MAEARERADATAESYSASPRARRGAEVSKAGAGQWDGGRALDRDSVLPPPDTGDEAVVCVYITDKDDWAHRTFDDRCVRDDGTVTVG